MHMRGVALETRELLLGVFVRLSACSRRQACLRTSAYPWRCWPSATRHASAAGCLQGRQEGKISIISIPSAELTPLAPMLADNPHVARGSCPWEYRTRRTCKRYEKREKGRQLVHRDLVSARSSSSRESRSVASPRTKALKRNSRLESVSPQNQHPATLLSSRAAAHRNARRSPLACGNRRSPRRRSCRHGGRGAHAFAPHGLCDACLQPRCVACSSRIASHMRACRHAMQLGGIVCLCVCVCLWGPCIRAPGRGGLPCRHGAPSDDARGVGCANAAAHRATCAKHSTASHTASEITEDAREFCHLGAPAD